MAKRIIDYDPLTRTTTYHEYDSLTDTTHIEEVQDIEPYLATAHEMRKDEDYTKKGIKEEFWHYARIPNLVAEKMLIEDGVNIFERGQEKEVLKLLNSKYSYLKTTRKKHC